MEEKITDNSDLEYSATGIPTVDAHVNRNYAQCCIYVGDSFKNTRGILNKDDVLGNKALLYPNFFYCSL